MTVLVTGSSGFVGCAIMARLAGLLGVVATSGKSPDRILHEINARLVEDNDACMFITIGCGLLDIRNGKFVVVRGAKENNLKNVDVTIPLGRLIAATDLNQVADRGLSGERTYLKGQFVVNFADTNKAVLRPRSRMPDSVMLLAGGNSTRIIVEYPAGYVPPKPGSIVSRDEVRPFEITEVRKQEDGQVNVFAREIMQP